MKEKKKSKKEKVGKIQMPERVYGRLPTQNEYQELLEDGGIAKVPVFVNPGDALLSTDKNADEMARGVKFAVYELVGYVTVCQSVDVSQMEDSDN